MTDIWKKPSEKPEIGRYVAWDDGLANLVPPDFRVHESCESKWCYLDDLLASSAREEEARKLASDNFDAYTKAVLFNRKFQKREERYRKALDIAIEGLEYMKKHHDIVNVDTRCDLILSNINAALTEDKEDRKC